MRSSRPAGYLGPTERVDHNAILITQQAIHPQLLLPSGAGADISVRRLFVAGRYWPDVDRHLVTHYPGVALHWSRDVADMVDLVVGGRTVRLFHRLCPWWRAGPLAGRPVVAAGAAAEPRAHPAARHARLSGGGQPLAAASRWRRSALGGAEGQAGRNAGQPAWSSGANAKPIRPRGTPRPSAIRTSTSYAITLRPCMIADTSGWDWPVMAAMRCWLNP